MKTITLKTKGREAVSRILCRKNAFSVLRGELTGREAFVFTDTNVGRIYGNKIRRYLENVPVYAMPAGEEFKTQDTLFALLKAMAEAGLHRGAVLVALGGGVVGDIGGLAASLYMRGISCIQVPTTLLAQVDSSVGGKTAIDFFGVKNLVGAFKQPEKVLVDGAFLSTLPPREVRCGLGEIVKHGALDGDLFDVLWARRDNLFDLAFLAEIVPQNIAIKAGVVKKDPEEKGLRKCLNLGHTTAHAFELAGGGLSHGEYVLIGTVLEAEIAKKHLDCDTEYLARLEELCKKALGAAPALSHASEAASLARLDKKNAASGQITLTVPVKKGEYALLELDFETYARELDEVKGALC